MTILVLRRLACLFLCFLVAEVSAQPREPIPAGPLTAKFIGYEFAVYYPVLPTKAPMAALQDVLRSSTNPPKLVTSMPDAPPAPLMHARFISDVQASYRPPSMDMLQRFGRGLTREQATAVQQSKHALVLDFAQPGDQAVPAYRASLRLAEQVARDTNGLLWDEETRELFTPDEWHKRRLETWEGDVPDVLKHIVIHAYQGEKLVRAISLGMGKLGLPDVVVNDFSWSDNRTMGNLINCFAQVIGEGTPVRTAGMMDFDLRAIRHIGVRQSQTSTLKANSIAVAKLSLVKGVWEDGDPRNRLIEIRFDRYPGPDHHAQQDALLASLFGTEESVVRATHNRELLAASKAAAAKLPALRDAFNKGLAPGEYIMVKAPFDTSAGGTEWMWVEVTRWSGDTIDGLLKNEPMDVPALHGGQMVRVSQSKVFDYIRRDPSGRDEGNESGKILQRMQASPK